MDLRNKTKALCQKHNIIPARSKGQNFLISESVYDKIIAAGDLQTDDVVLEVGPGFGFLTAKLASKVKKVIAVELDDKLASILKTNLAAQGIGNVEVVNDDILKFSIFNFQFSKNFQLKNFQFKIVANLPYNITSIFLRKFLSQQNIKPELTVLMLQKEVAERIVAKPPKMSLLAVSVQFYAQVEIIEYVPKYNFWPEPEVDSAIIKIKSKILNQKSEIVPGVDKEREFFRLVKFGFSARRKMLKNNLGAGYHIDNEKVENYLKLAKIPVKARAQELAVEDWVRLFEVTRQNML